MFESAMLSVCRLTDPPSAMRGKSVNITVQRVPEFVSSHPKAAEISSIVEKATEAAEFARSWRNKRLAHSDEDVRRGKAQLELASRQRMEAAIDAIASVVRWVGVEVLDTTIITHPISNFSDDEVAFLKVLYLGKLEQKSREEQAHLAVRSRRIEDAERLLRDDLPSWLTYRRPDPTE
ncbi:hypothetical protein AVO44_02920 [Ruegeria profundi]|uniref:HEPN AbiU2-like domain-containing protein n=2 Tax=Ruegeria profundi TaxID=1685378 RepID=A0A0X3U361_9RHOB|nr:hypothetical protein AVO44_02920 [Ruegeria profundi]